MLSTFLSLWRLLFVKKVLLRFCLFETVEKVNGKLLWGTIFVRFLWQFTKRVPNVFSSTQFLFIVRLKDTSHSFYDVIAHFLRSDFIGYLTSTSGQQRCFSVNQYSDNYNNAAFYLLFRKVQGSYWSWRSPHSKWCTLCFFQLQF